MIWIEAWNYICTTLHLLCRSSFQVLHVFLLKHVYQWPSRGIQWTKGTHSCQQGSSVQLRCYFRNQENPDKIDMVGGQACTILMKSIIEEKSIKIKANQSIDIDNPSPIDEWNILWPFIDTYWFSNVNRLIHCRRLILISHLWIRNILAKFWGFTNLEQMPTNFLQWRCQQDSHATYFQQNILLCWQLVESPISKFWCSS